MLRLIFSKLFAPGRRNNIELLLFKLILLFNYLINIIYLLYYIIIEIIINIIYWLKKSDDGGPELNIRLLGIGRWNSRITAVDEIETES